MGKFRVKIEKLAEGHIKSHIKAGNSATLKKIEILLKELSENPYSGTGKPERLKHDLDDFWSRRINQKDRMIYRVQESVVTVLVISAIGHYGDK